MMFPSSQEIDGLFKGCLNAIIVALLIALGIGIGVGYLVSKKMNPTTHVVRSSK